LEHLPSALQAASLGSVAVILAQPDGAHLALYGTIIATLGSIITTAVNRRADRTAEANRYAHEKEARDFQAEQVRLAFAAAVIQRDASEAHIVSKVQESTDASAVALNVANHANEKLTRVTLALGDAVAKI
jgi:hypothetical protein